jgi:23S rRNA pseudouridine2605 synthase
VLTAPKISAQFYFSLYPFPFSLGETMVRLQKFLAEAGIASRRASEQIILAGRVSINGKPVQALGTKIDPLHDKVTVDGKSIRAKRKLYIALNKPPGVVCTRAADEDRPKIGDLLPREWSDLVTVGRLDYESEGLIFLTNDGEFCLKLTHPRYGVRKIYMVTIEGRVEAEMLKTFTKGIVHQGDKLRAERAIILRASKSSSLVELELSEGKNREVRRLFESQNLRVLRLQRTRIGRIKLGELPEGKWRALTEPEIKSLLGQNK